MFTTYLLIYPGICLLSRGTMEILELILMGDVKTFPFRRLLTLNPVVWFKFLLSPLGLISMILLGVFWIPWSKDKATRRLRTQRLFLRGDLRVMESEMRREVLRQNRRE